MNSTSHSRSDSTDSTKVIDRVPNDPGGSSSAAARTTSSRPQTQNSRTGSPSGSSQDADSRRGTSRSEAARPQPAGAAPRRVRLTLARLDPYSVMKMSFLIGIAVGIATVVAVIVLWQVVDVIGLWSRIEQLGRDINSGNPLPFMELFEFKKFVAYGGVIAGINVVIITALGTLGAFLYNIVAALLGGLRLTFTDD